MQTASLSKKHKKVDIPPRPDWWDSTAITPQQVITIKWHNQDGQWWNETCAMVLEVFGLPGGRYYYKPYQSHMTFTFKSVKDAELCRILLSERL